MDVRVSPRTTGDSGLDARSRPAPDGRVQSGRQAIDRRRTARRLRVVAEEPAPTDVAGVPRLDDPPALGRSDARSSQRQPQARHVASSTTSNEAGDSSTGVSRGSPPSFGHDPWLKAGRTPGSAPRGIVSPARRGVKQAGRDDLNRNLEAPARNRYNRKRSESRAVTTGTRRRLACRRPSDPRSHARTPCAPRIARSPRGRTRLDLRDRPRDRPWPWPTRGRRDRPRPGVARGGRGGRRRGPAAGRPCARPDGRPRRPRRRRPARRRGLGPLGRPRRLAPHRRGRHARPAPAAKLPSTRSSTGSGRSTSSPRSA